MCIGGVDTPGEAAPATLETAMEHGIDDSARAMANDPRSTNSGAWVNEGVFEVAPGVHRIPLPLPNDGLRAVNVYVISTPTGLTLIDGGWAIPQSRALLEKGIKSLGAELTDIENFYVTHVHRDHYTLATAVRKEVGSTVHLGEGERPTLEYLLDDARQVLASELDLLITLGAEPLAKRMREIFPEAPTKAAKHGEIWEMPDKWLGGETLTLAQDRRLEAVPTPGHTAGHVVFHDTDAGLLFAGDHVLPTITPSIGFEPVRVDNPLGSFLRSLAIVRERPDAMLLPAHGPVTDSVHARVDELLAHHATRLDETEDAIRQGASTAYDAAAILRWTRHQRHRDELDPFNAMLCVAETGAHLDLLAAQGRLVKDTSDGIRRYR